VLNTLVFINNKAQSKFGSWSSLEAEI